MGETLGSGIMTDASNQEMGQGETSRAPHSLDEGTEILRERLGLITKATEYNPSWLPGNYWRPILLILDADAKTARMPWYGGGGSNFAEKDKLELSLREVLIREGFKLDAPTVTTTADWSRTGVHVEPSHVWGEEKKLVPNPSRGIAAWKHIRAHAVTQIFTGPKITFVHGGGIAEKELCVTKTDYQGDVSQRVWRIYSTFPNEASSSIPSRPPALGRGWVPA